VRRLWWRRRGEERRRDWGDIFDLGFHFSERVYIPQIDESGNLSHGMQRCVCLRCWSHTYMGPSVIDLVVQPACNEKVTVSNGGK
jgi:hypothetical protein